VIWPRDHPLADWLFIAPRSTGTKRRDGCGPFVLAERLFFLSGCAFGYFEAFPLVVGFLVGVGKPFQAVITINEYLSTATKIILGLRRLLRDADPDLSSSPGWAS
jgi:Sec-independent protein secretion pathway component TatC